MAYEVDIRVTWFWKSNKYQETSRQSLASLLQNVIPVHINVGNGNAQLEADFSFSLPGESKLSLDSITVWAPANSFKAGPPTQSLKVGVNKITGRAEIEHLPAGADVFKYVVIVEGV